MFNVDVRFHCVYFRKNLSSWNLQKHLKHLMILIECLQFIQTGLFFSVFFPFYVYRKVKITEIALDSVLLYDECSQDYCDKPSFSLIVYSVIILCITICPYYCNYRVSHKI